MSVKNIFKKLEIKNDIVKILMAIMILCMIIVSIITFVKYQQNDSVSESYALANLILPFTLLIVVVIAKDPSEIIFNVKMLPYIGFITYNTTLSVVTYYQNKKVPGLDIAMFVLSLLTSLRLMFNML